MDIKNIFNSLTPEEIHEINEEQLADNEKVYKELSAAYKKGQCSLCKKSLNFFYEDSPCLHWFLKPSGIKKKHFERYLRTEIGFSRFDSYIRWVANLEAPFKNINDLKDEKDPSKLIEYTVKYKNLEWSVSMGQTDFQGHTDSTYGKFPHFHIQMLVDDRVFIRFNDFHIPLSEVDIFRFKAILEVPEKVRWENSYGTGMSILENIVSLEKIDDLMKVADDEENATFNTSSLFEMPKGKTMSGDILAQLFKESAETKTPVRHLIKKYYPEVNIITEIRPGDGVPDIAKRNKRK